MRYYNIKLSGGGVFGSGWTSHPGDGDIADPGAQEVLMNLEVFNGTPDAQYSTSPSDGSTIEIKGVSWEQIKNSNKLIRQPISIYGGMKPGLPLATAQSKKVGLLVTGTIFQTWGNWVGTEMSLGMTIVASQSQSSVGQPGLSSGLTGKGTAGAEPPANAPPAPQMSTADAQNFRTNRTGFRSIDRRTFARGGVPSITPFDLGGLGSLGIIGSVGGGGFGTSNFGGIISSLIGGGIPGLTQPLNLIHNLQPNQPLASAIAQTLSTAFPNLKAKINISSKLKLNYQDAGVYQNIQQYAAYILNLSRSVLGAKNYLGVHMAVNNNELAVWDQGTNPDDITAIDLIGQPTWVAQDTVEIKVVMRARLKLGQIVHIPPGTLTNFSGGGAISPIMGGVSKQRSNVTMEAIPITITKITHIGDFRNPDGNYWCTVIRGLAPNPPDVPIPDIPSSIVPGRSTGPTSSGPNITIGPIGHGPATQDIFSITPNPKGGPSVIRQEIGLQNIYPIGSVFKRSIRKR